MIISFALEYAIRRFQVKQDGLQLNVTHQLLVYVYNVNIFGESINTIKKNTGSSLVTSKEIGPEVNADKSKYMIVSQDQNAGRSHDIKIDNSSSERVDELKYLGTTLTNQNSIQEEIKSRLELGMLAIIRCRIFFLPVFYQKI